LLVAAIQKLIDVPDRADLVARVADRGRERTVAIAEDGVARACAARVKAALPTSLPSSILTISADAAWMSARASSARAWSSPATVAARAPRIRTEPNAATIASEGKAIRRSVLLLGYGNEYAVMKDPLGLVFGISGTS